MSDVNGHVAERRARLSSSSSEENEDNNLGNGDFDSNGEPVHKPRKRASSSSSSSEGADDNDDDSLDSDEEAKVGHYDVNKDVVKKEQDKEDVSDEEESSKDETSLVRAKVGKDESSDSSEKIVKDDQDDEDSSISEKPDLAKEGEENSPKIVAKESSDSSISEKAILAEDDKDNSQKIVAKESSDSSISEKPDLAKEDEENSLKIVAKESSDSSDSEKIVNDIKDNEENSQKIISKGSSNSSISEKSDIKEDDDNNQNIVAKESSDSSISQKIAKASKESSDSSEEADNIEEDDDLSEPLPSSAPEVKVVIEEHLESKVNPINHAAPSSIAETEIESKPSEERVEKKEEIAKNLDSDSEDEEEEEVRKTSSSSSSEEEERENALSSSSMESSVATPQPPIMDNVDKKATFEEPSIEVAKDTAKTVVENITKAAMGTTKSAVESTKSAVESTETSVKETANSLIEAAPKTSPEMAPKRALEEEVPNKNHASESPRTQPTVNKLSMPAAFATNTSSEAPARPPASPTPQQRAAVTKMYTEALERSQEGGNVSNEPVRRRAGNKDITALYTASVERSLNSPPSSPSVERRRPKGDVVHLYTDKIREKEIGHSGPKFTPKKHNLSTVLERDAIREAYEAVRTDASDTDWAVFKFDGNKLAVTETGGDFGEFKKCFGSADRGFGYIRIKTGDEMSKRAKFVLVTWVGPDVPVMRKAKMSTDKALLKDVIQNFSVELQLESHAELSHEFFKVEVDKAAGARYGTGMRDV